MASTRYRLWRSACIAIAPLAAAIGCGGAQAQTDAPALRDLCADRPGLDTPPCTLDKGHVAIELGLGDWTRDKNKGIETDKVAAGDWLIRVGVTDSLEAQFGWTSYSHVRLRDRQTGVVDTASGVGDVTIALRQNLRNPDGSDVSIAVMPYVSLPAGAAQIGAGDWGAGLLLPMTFDLANGLSLALTPEIDAAVDSDGDGRHLAFGTVVGLGIEISDRLSGTVELSVMRDRDPDGHGTDALAGLSLGWQPDANLQFDIGLNLGLNRNSPDSEIYFGLVRRF